MRKKYVVSGKNLLELKEIRRKILYDPDQMKEENEIDYKTYGIASSYKFIEVVTVCDFLGMNINQIEFY